MFSLLVASRQLYGDFLMDLLAHLLYPSSDLKVDLRTSGFVDQHHREQQSGDGGLEACLASWLHLVSGMAVPTLLVLALFLLLFLSALHIPLPVDICDRKKIQVFEFVLRLSNEYLGDIVESLGGPVMRNKLTRILVSFPYLFQAKTPKWCQIRAENIAGIRCRVYLPQGKHRKSNSAVIYIHGGGWCIMRPKFYDGPILSLIERIGCPVISIDYHLSPEAKFPSAILECERVIQEIHEKKFSDYNIDVHRIALMGDSAGGNISAVLCQRALRQKRSLSKVLVYPVIHLLDTLSPAYRHYYSTYKGSSLLNPKTLIRWYLMYLGVEPTQENIEAVMRNQHIPKEIKEDIGINRLIDTSTLPSCLLEKKTNYVKLPSPSFSTDSELAEKMKKFLMDPNLCPLLGKDLTGLPPAMMITAGVDILRDEGVLYARRMRDFGVPVQWSHYQAAFHGILHMPASKQRTQMLDDIAAYLQQNL